MKRNKLFLFFALIFVLCTFVLVACHTHTFEDSFTFDDVRHWQKATCGHDYAEEKTLHVFAKGFADEHGTEYYCVVCGYSYKDYSEPHRHTFGNVYSYDKTHHFLPSTCGHNVVDEMVEHAFDGGVPDSENNITYTCTVCGYYFVDETSSTHVHTYANTYSYNADVHYYASTCGHNVIIGEEPHTLVNGACKCGYSLQPKTFTFVSINDLHGYVEQENGQNGFSNTAYAIDRLSAFGGYDEQMVGNNQDVVLFANGDMFQGTAISNMSRGLAVVKAMNEMGFAGMGIGNHEFDWGLETVLQYWDGIDSNGEANFPLVNGNIRQKSDGKLVGDVSNDDNICNGIIVNKQGINIGIVSVIGPCQNSILQTRLTNYTFEDVVSSVEQTAKQLKNAGAQLISVNIHYGNSGGVTKYSANSQIAGLKDGNGKYLVDVIFNGHTHTFQSGTITRSNGTAVPVVQAGGYNNALAMVKLTYNPIDGKVTVGDYGYKYVEDVGTNCIADVQNVITEYHSELLANLPAIAISGATLKYKSDLYTYMGKVMVNALGTDYAVSNTGGLRSTGGIKMGKAITEATLYEIIPFDNTIYYVTIKGSALYDFYTNDNAKNNVGSYYYFGVGNNTPIELLRGSNDYYTLAIIDYVYTSEYFSGRYGNYLPYILSTVETNIMLRDILLEEVKLWGISGENWTPRGNAKITLQYVY